MADTSDKYAGLCYRFARELTLGYSSSFGLGSRFFTPGIRPHIYAIYAVVRGADEIVDTYQGAQPGRLLDGLEAEIFNALKLGYSSNPIVHAFALTARKFEIDPLTIKAFFRSMRLDLTEITYTPRLYDEYIFGSAEAVGLMCLRVFCGSNDKLYTTLTPGARALGAAYQKVNFLRDIGDDHRERGRMYFPGSSYEDFDEKAKMAVVDDIESDFQKALPAISQLPSSSRNAVLVSYKLYRNLLDKLRVTPIETIKRQRIRISAAGKVSMALTASVKGRA